ncbi:potassium-transporting ATPase subunit KdpA [Enterococcus gallinarum]|nr:potassium-transporting ATPase subunit KdpA [Enterococcus gallinarum]
MVRGLLYILLPLSTIIAILLISQGVVQTFSSGMAYNSLEGENLWLYLGPVASQVAIKQLGTNGGGFLGPIRPIHLRIRRFFQTLSRI